MTIHCDPRVIYRLHDLEWLGSGLAIRLLCGSGKNRMGIL